MNRITDHSDGLVKAFPCKATDVFHFDRYKKLGRYKQWNGLQEWNTGLDYWTEIFSFFGQVSVLFLKEP